MTDALDVDLQDLELREEIDLVSELMVAAAAAPTALTQAQVDAVLNRVPAI